MMLSWYTPSKALLSGLSLDLCREFPSVTALNLGGGYKVRRCKLNPIENTLFQLWILAYVCKATVS